MKSHQTILHWIQKFPQRPNTQAAMKYQSDSGWTELSWAEYYDKIQRFAFFLQTQGLEFGQRVAIYANTRYEWAVADLATLSLGGIIVPIYHNISDEDLEHILNKTKVNFLIIEGRTQWRTYLRTQKDGMPEQKVILIDDISVDASEIPSHIKVFKLHPILEEGSVFPSQQLEQWIQIADKVNLDTTATILFTSGTTGKPKGVVLTHRQIVGESIEAFNYAGLLPTDISLSFLPWAHILGRVEIWGHAFHGYQICVLKELEKIKDALLEIEPTVFIGVPRIFEKIYSLIHQKMEEHPFKAVLFEQALEVGLQVGEYKLKQEPIPLALQTQYSLMQKIFLNKVKHIFGRRLRFAVSGGAPLAKEINEFFHACGVLILEGYGLTETTAAITLNVPFDYRFGSVGKAFGDTQVLIADDGEILIKGSKVMKEYYEDPEATAEVFTHGWFKTGDIGVILPNGDLKITDRKKDLIKTSGGKYVAPQKLEGLLKQQSPLISHALVHGDKKKFIVALLTLNKDSVIQIAKEHQLSYEDYTALTQHPVILEKVRNIVRETNRLLASFESIKRFSILPEDFTVESGELTPSMKVRRKFLDKKYSSYIDKLYLM